LAILFEYVSRQVILPRGPVINLEIYGPVPSSGSWTSPVFMQPPEVVRLEQQGCQGVSG
jgi:hypothetical protein